MPAPSLAALMVAAQLQLGAVQQIDAAVTAGIAGGVYPGAVVVIGTRDSVLLSKGYGSFTWSGGRVPDPDSTLFDLASLTKVVATTPAVMLLVDRDALTLDRPVQAYLPEFAGDGKGAVTVRHLLEHRSGLRAFLPLNERAAGAAEARRLVLEEPLSFRPGSRVVYSDLNAMLLGWIVEDVTGDPLDVFVARELFPVMGMSETRFRPPRALRNRIVPVGLWRGHVIAGELHDQNAVRLGGVSGHAGLYSTGRDLARYAQTLLANGRAPKGTQVFAAATVRGFTARGPGNRGLGWDMRDTAAADGQAGSLSAAAFGHGGYTGTSIWVDPMGDLFVVMLTNRVYDPRTSRSISKLLAIRGRVADAAIALRLELCGLPTMRATDVPRC
jgi:CubicO group peptidase (beta-lactamase class C family)